MNPEESQKLIYYYQNLPEAALPTVPNWRHYKLRFFDGTWKSIDQTVATIQDLRNQIVKYSMKYGPPKDVYYSVGRWLSPATLTTKRHRGRKGREDYGQFKWGDNNFLGCELVLDFDEDIITFNEFARRIIHDAKFVKSQVELAITVLNDNGYNDLTFVKTGRGVQTHVNDWENKTITKRIELPGERENHYHQMLTNTAVKLMKAGVVFDFSVSKDVRRMTRMPYSIYGSLGTICVSASNINYIVLDKSKRIY